MSSNFANIFNNFEYELDELHDKIIDINDNFNENNFNINQETLFLILKISDNIKLLKNQLEDLEILALNTISNELLTNEQKEILRQKELEDKVKKLFLPYVLFAQVCLENLQ